MPKKIDRLEDYITASDAALILSLRMKRTIKPGYVHKIRDVRFVKLNATTKLYHRSDIQQVTIRQKGA